MLAVVSRERDYIRYLCHDFHDLVDRPSIKVERGTVKACAADITDDHRPNYVNVDSVLVEEDRAEVTSKRIGNNEFIVTIILASRAFPRRRYADRSA